ncbi:copper amine oxidase N-terminal domain-containing protein [Anaerosphaera multitolerans]|uniref:Copper amine oxidase N-terminal domain-containing protein n=1 Tax=Anaerosphaera multitolerans TaxID=2487351 RepID=A0A437S4Y1_9FIRM|nr:copper amine oxidase N-terminal domain-containing protein [Anaerosphaera multitolerans]RVU54027.1 copper amine oxidase N-terminal domain-containing protein [Anaerosphaera multitolerans]
MLKKLLLVPVLILSLLPVSAFAESTTDIPEKEYVLHNGEIKSIVKEEDEKTISEILFKYNEDDKENEIRLSISDKTLILNGENSEKAKAEDIVEGAEITVAYPSKTPVGMSFPPVLSPKLIIIQGETPIFLKVSSFNDSLVSSDNLLKLNLSEDVKILDENLTAKTAEDIKGNTLAVLYGVSTRSIPAQTTPNLVVILDNNVEQTEDKEPMEVNREKIVIGGEEMTLKNSLLSDDLFPLREISESMEFKITWKDSDKSIEIEKDDLKVTILNNEYESEVNFENPKRVQGVTYVPQEFFSELLKVNVTLENGVYQFKN